MTDDKVSPPAPKPAKTLAELRWEREAAALRANLHKRKEFQRGRAAEAATRPEPPSDET